MRQITQQIDWQEYITIDNKKKKINNDNENQLNICRVYWK